jgi:hypothetical protein
MNKIKIKKMIQGQPEDRKKFRRLHLNQWLGMGGACLSSQLPRSILGIKRDPVSKSSNVGLAEWVKW